MSADWAQVYRSTYHDLVRFLYRKVWDAHRAQDLAQETFVRCLRSAEQPSDLVNARAFVFTIAGNLARDEARTVIRRKKHLTLFETETAHSVSDADAQLDAIERERRVSAVAAALAGLSERDRAVLLLWDAGLSYPQIAEQTGMAIGAIGTTLCRARKRLVESYDEIERQKHVAHR